MRFLKVGAAILNQTPLDWDGNRDRILAAIDAARREDVSVLLCPELCISGYGCEDAFFSAGLQRTSLEVLAEIRPATRGLVVSVGLPILYQNILFNAACLLVDGAVVGFVAKRHLAQDGIHYEPRWFKPWPAGETGDLGWAGESYPIGDLLFDVGGVRIGFEICEDAWVAKRRGAELAGLGVDIILNPSASHFAFEKKKIRERYVTEGSRAFGVTYIFSNLVGNEAGRAIYDGGAMIASGGKLRVNGPRFSFRDVHLTTSTVDIEATRMVQARVAGFQPRPGSEAGTVVRVPFRYAEVESGPKDTTAPAWESSEELKEEEFTRAVALALYDYMRKSRSRGFVVSLSGGADSAACAILSALSVHLGVDELGLGGYLERLRYFSALQEKRTARDVIEAVLLCVYQSTRNSSDTTLRAAQTVAESVGARFVQVSVDEQVESYKKLVASTLGRELTWEEDDLTLQNIQARARAPGVWMFANLRGALLLATSNRSEAAVGYTTMDGDTCGGISPIAGIDKAFLRQWLTWLETSGPAGIGPIPELRLVNEQEPTAELRPLASQQTDERDLMPYEVLDRIERLAIRDKKTPLECYRILRRDDPGYSASELASWVEHFFRLWCRNQWKRERYAPSFHLDDENLDPKTWCRFPILSGGFARELRELRKFREGEGE